jgi:VanZ family protein
MDTGCAGRTTIFKVSFCLTALGLAGIGLYPDLQLPEPTLTRGFTDKIYHVLGCMLLVLQASKAWRLGSVWLLLAFPLGLGIELAQGFAPGRSVHMSDMVANLSGVVLGLLIIMGLRCSKRSGGNS